MVLPTRSSGLVDVFVFQRQDHVQRRLYDRANGFNSCSLIRNRLDHILLIVHTRSLLFLLLPMPAHRYHLPEDQCFTSSPSSAKYPRSMAVHRKVWMAFGYQSRTTLTSRKSFAICCCVFLQSLLHLLSSASVSCCRTIVC